MLKILIIDDEAPARNRLRRMLAELPEVYVTGEAATGQEALKLIPSKLPDVLLLDISMPGLSGMELAKMLQKQGSAPAIIFCTAWSDQAVDAFECDAVDYLVKPVRAERLVLALDKARRFLARSGSDADGSFLRSTLGSKVRLLPMAEVIYLSSEDKYTMAVYQGGKMVINESLSDLENEYADILVRVHRGALVMKKRIRGLDKNRGGRHLIKLDGCEDRPQVSRRNLPAIRKLIRELT
ncbi:MAG: LytTR family DNA-binding domain-containing protein [Lysobacterales bacterium]